MLKNKTQNKIIVKNKKICHSFFSKLIGLMFSKKKDDFALIFQFDDMKERHLHMFFVYFAIDVLFLDANKKIIEKKENFKPFTLYSSKTKANYVIELPLGKGKLAKRGDILEF